jgi:hypothetical protein
MIKTHLSLSFCSNEKQSSTACRKGCRWCPQFRDQPQNADKQIPGDGGLLPIIKLLSGSGAHILKEKPFAMSTKEACEIHEVVESSGIIMMATSVRRKQS